MPKTTASTAAVAGSAQPQPCAKQNKQNQRVSIFNPFTNRMARVSPYSAKAKKIYRYYIEELDYDPAWLALARAAGGAPLAGWGRARVRWAEARARRCRRAGRASGRGWLRCRGLGVVAAARCDRWPVNFWSIDPAHARLA